MKRLSAISFAAALLLSWGAAAAPTIVSPADYAAVSTMTAKFKGYLDDPDFTTSYFNYTDYGQPNSVRVAQRYESYSNSAPVTVSWSGSSGTCTVKLWRTHKDSASNPVFTKTTTGTSVSFYDLEIGRNYTWSVTDGNGTATGHFYTLRNAPRMINSQNPDTPGAECSNGRDMGGRLTADGTKAIRQGLIFRTAQLEYCNPRDTTTGVYGEMQWLKNTLGVKLDVDLRDKSHLLENYVGTGQGTNDNPARAYCGEYNFRYTWKNNSILTSINESSIGEGITRFCVSATTGRTFPSWDGFFSTDANKKAVWYAFDAIYESVKKGEPLVFHCSHGKDRGGTLAFVLHGVLGVTKAEAIKDFGISWFDNPDETLNFNTITTKIVNKLAEYTGDTLQQQCAAYLAQCGQKYGLTLSAAQAKVADFQALMLEDIEAADGGDTFAYTDYYWRRDNSGGTWSSSTGYWYKNSSESTKYPGGTNPNAYQNRCFLWPTASLPYARPVCGYARMGKLVTVCENAASDAPAGFYNLKAYFTSDGHTLADRTIIEHRSGVGDYENVDLYFTTYDESNLGEKNLGAAYVYSGTAAIEVWANATLRVRDLRDMAQKHSSSKKYKAYVKFPSGNCDNARFEVLETDVGAENILGWFTGGQAGTTQHLKVGSAILQFNAPGKTSGVEGALVLEFELGSANTTSSAAMLKIAGALRVNAGSSIVVDASGKGAGTYKLVQAGTLTDNANLPANATVSNCKSGYAGTVVRSGNNLDLVITEEQTAVVTDETLFHEHPEWGYKVTGLGAGRNETALVFTNQKVSASFTMSDSRANVRFLVVGGGGGGGADLYDDVRQGGGGGGGGGVVTGIVAQVAKDAVLTVSVGSGGEGGVMASKRNGNYGASSAGAASSFAVDGTVYVTALGGGADGGSGTSTAYIGNAGGAGGSSAGSRPGNGMRTAAADTSSCINATALANIPAYGVLGNPGGTGNTVSFYGYYLSAGGGGGATEAGGDGAAFDEANAATSSLLAGRGGEGLSCDITGTTAVYGSGGGGGSVDGGDEPYWPKGSRGGTGAGDGNYLSPTDSGTDGLPNQGGGGGGGGRQANGGRGGSGIVVLRFATVAAQTPVEIAVPVAVAGLAYDGAMKTGVLPGTGYTLTGNTATEAGNYTATATLLDGYCWTGGSTAPAQIAWSIAEAQGDTPGPFTVTLFDEHPEWGYKVEGLGVGHDETALVFTNQAATMSWTVPADLENVRFLVVGGGGGGGADINPSSGSSPFLGGGGGGGGGVVTGVVSAVSSGSALAISVGAGGAGGQCSSTKVNGGYGASYAGASSTLSLNGATVVTAYGGGNDKGTTGDHATSGQVGGTGGSNAGSRAGVGTAQGTPTRGSVASSFVSQLAGYGVLGNVGGHGHTGTAYYGSQRSAAGGGGGATEAGATPADYTVGGKGGEGLASDITGTTAVYGSGGGGGTISRNLGGQGGTGAGDGNLTAGEGADGQSALANQGGGGGGGGRSGNGGNGGSGIIVLRFVLPGATPEPEPEPTAIAVPVAETGLSYTGAEQTGVADGEGYTLAGNTATMAGDYTATATLKGGYCWTGGSTEPAQIPWSIAKAENAWTVSPVISKPSWTAGETAGELTEATTLFGAPEATIAKDGGPSDPFNGTLPTEAGSYVVTYVSAAADNWLAPTPASMSVAFTIIAASEPGEITVTLFDEHPEWGYKVEGLGAGHDETALVFTNQAAAMSWTVPADLENIQFLAVGGGGGGGADLSTGDQLQGGAGGGGGGVVTGLVAQVSKDAAITVTVGAGGAGGVVATKRNGYWGAAAAGGASSFQVDGVAYVTALGGGADQGSAKQNASGNAGGAGGSSAGSRPGNATHTAAASTASCVNSAALPNILCYGALGNAGGCGTTTAAYGYYFAAGGGGGATAAGGDGTSDFVAGDGGEGLASDITGTAAVYGSGGGGGSIASGSVGRGGTAGTGAGDGNKASAAGAGNPALANQGGGGGGGGRNASGGKGGSGIVVLRFRVPGVAPALPQVAGADIAPAEVFTKAKVSKAIVYPSEPTVTGDVGAQVISFGGVDVDVPDYYTASKSDNVVTLALNDNAKPVITDEDETPGIVIVDGKVHIHLGNVKSALYYTILTATSLDSGDWTPCGAAEQGQDDFEFNASGATRFYKASVRDEAE